MNVESLMTHDVRTCHPKDTLQTAARIMWDRDCGVVPVVDGQSRVVGMITDRDICMAACLQDKALRDLLVENTMTREIHGCRPAATVRRAEELMEEFQVRRLPVVDEHNQILGIISLNDVAREAEREQSQAGQHEVPEAEVAEALAIIGRPRMAQPAA